ncbi:hypothetical protein ATANTOWER_025232 [Ataeniobius toweri]|uniref:Uncharacterized protein n=1 Tax=Ataeniobius toweri TaxID=208326 RepID=A0ABU7CIF6_9TELE|nr:hypothetical protein [Ataeniobius toweri]
MPRYMNTAADSLSIQLMPAWTRKNMYSQHILIRALEDETNPSCGAYHRDGCISPINRPPQLVYLQLCVFASDVSDH